MHDYLKTKDCHGLNRLRTEQLCMVKIFETNCFANIQNTTEKSCGFFVCNGESDFIAKKIFLISHAVESFLYFKFRETSDEIQNRER